MAKLFYVYLMKYLESIIMCIFVIWLIWVFSNLLSWPLIITCHQMKLCEDKSIMKLLNRKLEFKKSIRKFISCGRVQSHGVHHLFLLKKLVKFIGQPWSLMVISVVNIVFWSTKITSAISQSLCLLVQKMKCSSKVHEFILYV